MKTEHNTRHAHGNGGAFRGFSRRFFNDRRTVIGLALLVIICAAAALAPVLTVYSPNALDVMNNFASASKEHIFGTDALGRDLYTRLIYGGRRTLLVSCASCAVAVLIGGVTGIVAGYFGGRCGRLIMKLNDMLCSMPTVLLAVLIIGVSSDNITGLILAVGISLAPGFAIFLNTAVSTIVSSGYMTAERAMGISGFTAVWRHVIPNISGQTVAYIVSMLTDAIITSSCLGYIGIGSGMKQPEWGAMIGSGRNGILSDPKQVLLPAAAVMLLILSLGRVGRGLRDAFDPSVGVVKKAGKKNG